jgi:hypothetical protein
VREIMEEKGVLTPPPLFEAVEGGYSVAGFFFPSVEHVPRESLTKKEM